MLITAIVVPIAFAALSPLLAWRQPIYIIAGFAGIFAMAFLLLQPLLLGGYLPSLTKLPGRRAHRWIGGALIATLVIHVGGLWITSPPDVIGAFLIASPTPFSALAVIAMWSVFGAAFLAAFRKRLHMRSLLWHRSLAALVIIAIVATVAHAMLIEGQWKRCQNHALRTRPRIDS